MKTFGVARLTPEQALSSFERLSIAAIGKAAVVSPHTFGCGFSRTTSLEDFHPWLQT
jgi:hypothetical protein